MKWHIASARALEMAAWSLAPVAALGVHQALRLKFAFLQRHQFVIANVNDRALWSESIWKLAEQHYGLLCLAAVLVPATCCFIQHLGLRWWWRTLIGVTVCAPALWYASVVWHLFGKVITRAP